MNYNLAQINIAKFILPMEDPINADFINNLDRVNAIAETQPGFVWRLTGDGNNALDIHAFEDPNIASNMSIWKDMKSLFDFVYSNQDHRDIMRRRKEWFEKIEFHMALWWVKEGEQPTLKEGIKRLNILREQGPNPRAFTFKKNFPAPE